MAVVMTSLTSGGDTVDATSFATASVTPTGGKLILLAVMNSKGTADTPTATGNSLTWVQVATKAYNTDAGPSKRVTVFRAMGTAPTAGAITIDFGGVLQNACIWNVAEFSGVDVSGTNGSGAIAQSVTGVADGAASVTATLAAFGAVSNVTYGAFGVNGTNVASVGSGFTIVGAEQSVLTPSVRLICEWQAANDTSVDASVASGTPAWGAIGIEIKAAIRAPSTVFVGQAVNRSAVI